MTHFAFVGCAPPHASPLPTSPLLSAPPRRRRVHKLHGNQAPICDLTAIFRNARLMRIGADSDEPLRHGPLSSHSGIAGPNLVNDTKSRTHGQDSCRTDGWNRSTAFRHVAPAREREVANCFRKLVRTLTGMQTRSQPPFIWARTLSVPRSSLGRALATGLTELGVEREANLARCVASPIR